MMRDEMLLLDTAVAAMWAASVSRIFWFSLSSWAMVLSMVTMNVFLRSLVILA